MSDLTAAMQAAVDSVDADRRRHGGDVAVARRPQPSSVELREEFDLPPIRTRSTPRTFRDALGEQFGPAAVTVWTALRETAAMVSLFWVCAILLAFVEVEGTVHVPGVGDATVITVAIVAASVLRAVLLAASRSGRALVSRGR